MAINDTVQLAVLGTVGGQTHVHTLHFRQMSDPAATDQSLIDAWQTNVRDTYRNLFSTADNPVQRITARQVCGTIPLRAAVEEVEVAPNIAGSQTVSGERMPSWLAAVVSVRTSLSGRRRRGRFFIGGLYEIMQNAGTLDPPQLGAVQAYIDDLIAAFVTPSTGTGGWRLVVHSRTLAQPGVQCQDSSTLVSGMIARSAIGSMKSRRAGSGT